MKKEINIINEIHAILETEGMVDQIKTMHINKTIVTNDSMSRPETGPVTQLNGSVGTIELKDGRKGVIVLTIDFAPSGGSNDILTLKSTDHD